MAELSHSSESIKILAFTDLSPNAQRTLQLLRPMIRQSHPHLTLVYVFPIPDTLRDQRVVLLWEDKVKTAAAALINEQIHRALGDGIEVTFEARMGQVEDELRTEMKSRRYTMVLLLSEQFSRADLGASEDPVKIFETTVTT